MVIASVDSLLMKSSATPECDSWVSFMLLFINDYHYSKNDIKLHETLCEAMVRNKLVYDYTDILMPLFCMKIRLMLLQC